MSRFYGDLFVMLLFSLMVTPAVRGRHENPLAELSSRSELVELAGYGEEKLSSVEVAGTVICEACSDGETGTFPFPISGALVAVTCKNGRRKLKTHWAAKTETNDYGDFIIDLPSHLHAIPDMEKACFVRVLRLPRTSPCKEASPSFMPIRLLSNRHYTRTYTTVENIRLQSTSRHDSRCLKKQNNAADATW